MLLRGLVLTLAPLLLSAAEIPQGAHVLLRMMNSVSTRTAKVGDTVYLQTATPIVDHGQVVAPVNSYVQGIVSQASRGGRVSGRAQLGIRLDTITLPAGQAFKFTPRLAGVDSGETGQHIDSKETTINQGGEKGKDAARVAITAGSGAAIGAMVDRSVRGAGIGAGAGTVVGLATVMLTRGHDVELKHGATLDVVFDRAVPIE